MFTTGTFNTATTGGLQAVAIGNVTPGSGAFTTLSSSGAATLNSASVTNNATVGGTLGVTGATTLTTATTGGLQAVAIGNVTPGSGTFTSLTASSLTLAAINGTVIGNVTPATGTFTTLTATNFSSGNAQITGGNLTGISIEGVTTLQATNFSSGNVLLTGGSINSTPIGATTASTGAFTTGTFSSTLGVTGATTLTTATTGGLQAVAIGNVTPGTAVFTTASTGGLQAVAIGNVTPGSGAFTTITASSTLGVTGATTLTTATTGGLQAVAIGNVTPGSGAFTTLTSSGTIIAGGNIVANSGTTSTSNTTGAIILTGSGGIGIGGNINAGAFSTSVHNIKGNVLLGQGSASASADSIVTINLNTDTPVASNATVHLSATTSKNAIYGADSFGAGTASQFNARHARGTSTTPSAVQSGDTYAIFAGRGYGATGYQYSTTAPGLAITASENYTDSAQGASVKLIYTPNGTVTGVTGLLIDGATGNVAIGATTTSSSTTTGALVVSGGAGIAGAVYAGSVYDNGNRVLSTSSGAGNLSISGTAVTLSATGPGVATTGGASQTVTVTTDAYGRVSAISAQSIAITGSQVSGTVPTANVALYKQVTALSNNQTYYPMFSNVSATGNTTSGVNSSLSYNPSTGTLSATTFSGTVSATNVAGTVATANAAIYTGVTNVTTGTYYPLMGGQSTTGNTQASANSGLSYNAATGTLYASNFSGTMLGTIATANVAYYVNTTSVSTNATYDVFFGSSTSGNLQVDANSSLTYNPSTGRLSATSFSGAGTGLTGTASSLSVNYASTAGSASAADNAKFLETNGAVDYGVYYPTFVNTTSNGNLSYGMDGAGLLNYVPGSGTLTANIHILTQGANINTSQSSGVGSDLYVSGKNDKTLLWAHAGTYDSVIIGNSATTANTVNGAKLVINSTDTMMLPKGSNAQRPTASGLGTDTAGMFRYSTTANAVEWYNGTSWQSATTAFTVVVSDQFTGTGSQTAFTLSGTATTAGCVVSINGVVQIPTTAYSVSGTTLTFTEAPLSTDNIDVRRLTTTQTVTSLVSTSGKAQVQVDDITGITFQSASVGGTTVMTIPIGGGIVSYDANVSIASANTPTTIDSFASSTYRSAKYVVQITNGTNFQTMEALVVQDGTTASVVAYGTLQTSGNLGVLSATISGSNTLVQFTAANATNTVRTFRQYIPL